MNDRGSNSSTFEPTVDVKVLFAPQLVIGRCYPEKEALSKSDSFKHQKCRMIDSLHVLKRHRNAGTEDRR
jgi:hypothetical protein